MTNDPSMWTGYPEKNLLDKSLSYMISFLSRERETSDTICMWLLMIRQNIDHYKMMQPNSNWIGIPAIGKSIVWFPKGQPITTNS